MSVPSYLSKLSFNEFLLVLQQAKENDLLVSWDTFAVASIGTVVVMETKDGLKAYVITDVNFPSYLLISNFRVGQTAVTFASGGQVATISGVAISPILADAVSNWRILTSIDDTNLATFYGCKGFINTTSTLTVRAWRPLSAVGITPNPVDFSTFATDSGGVIDALEPHSHGLSTLTAPPFTTPLTFPATTPAVNIDWLLIHK